MGAGQDVPNPWMILPFGLLLVLMAAGSVSFPVWWGRHHPKVVALLSLIVLAYYFLALRAPDRVWETACDYVSFIAMTGSLFVVSGGIHLDLKGEATPLANAAFLLAGAVLANVLCSTGAAMLLIRPWLRMNRRRLRGYHVVFFIFILCNVGGCLTPIGNPPLFFGYLMGVPFWWVARHCLSMWAVGVGALLCLFALVDRHHYLRAPGPGPAEPRDSGRWKAAGLRNLVFLGVILAAVFISEPRFLREALMLAAALGSWFATPREVHEANHFNFRPVIEVAILFIGIFATMMPALDWLESHARSLGAATPGAFYWESGVLSTVLDNAPTYLCFLKAIHGGFVDPGVIAQVRTLIQNHAAGLAALAGPHAADVRQTLATLRQYHAAALSRGDLTADQIATAAVLGNPTLSGYVAAISVGSVFFGAATYIGNGPNLLVKAIADHAGERPPGFTKYVLNYSVPYLAPVLALVWFLFFRS